MPYEQDLWEYKGQDFDFCVFFCLPSWVEKHSLQLKGIFLNVYYSNL